MDVQDAGHSGTQISERSELERLAQVASEFSDRGLAHRVEGFVAWPGPRADAALHVLLVGLVLALSGGTPAVGLLGVLIVLGSSIGQRRGRVLLRHLLPRRRSYNVVARRGSGRRVIAVAFLDRPGTHDVARWTRRLLLVGLGLAAGLLALGWGGWTSPILPMLQLGVGGALALIGAGLLIPALRERGPADDTGLDRLRALADGDHSGVELWLVVSGAGWPGLDGLRALEEQHRHEWPGETQWLLLGGGEGARGWLARRRLPALAAEDALALIEREYDGADAPAAAEHELVRHPVGDGDGA